MNLWSTVSEPLKNLLKSALIVYSVKFPKYPIYKRSHNITHEYLIESMFCFRFL